MINIEVYLHAVLSLNYLTKRFKEAEIYTLRKKFSR